ncbi:hypothetical protein ACFL2C_04070 [Patescibacteria group bacterium]
MRIKIYTVLLAISILITNPKQVSGYTGITQTNSATLATRVHDNDYKEVKLRSFLQTYNSPISNQAEIFVKSANDNGLDWRLVPSITGVESTFGKHIPSNSYNAYGWANGKYAFESWEESIDHVSKTLKEKYIDRGADDVYKIGRIYAPPSPAWPGKVDYFMNKIDPLPLEFSL